MKLGMTRRACRNGVLLALLLAVGCAGRPGQGPSTERQRRDVLTQTQILATRASNLYDAVVALRSNWLLPRGIDSFQSPGSVLVYFDDTRLGGVETLQTISPSSIGYIQYFDGTDASGRWGLDHGHGVIYVSTLPQR